MNNDVWDDAVSIMEGQGVEDAKFVINEQRKIVEGYENEFFKQINFLNLTFILVGFGIAMLATFQQINLSIILGGVICAFIGGRAYIKFEKPFKKFKSWDRLGAEQIVERMFAELEQRELLEKQLSQERALQDIIDSEE